MPEEPGVKVEETDWVDISADLADVNDDNTHQDSSQQEDDEKTVILEEPGDDDDDGGDGVMELDDGIEKFMYIINFDFLSLQNLITKIFLQMTLLLGLSLKV